MASGNRAGDKAFAGFILKGVKETGEEFGVGAYGKVFAVDYYGTVCAAKEIHSSLISGVGVEEFQRTRDNFLRECRQCAELRHPNIVQFFGVYYRPSSPIPILVMEKMDESLRSALDRYSYIPMTIKLSVLLDVSLGLRYLHSQEIIHRDLSSNNILLTSLLRSIRAKISDLGVAKVVRTDSKKFLTKIPGTADFMPPEAKQDNKPIRYNCSLDVFSYGGVVLHTATHQWPQPSAMKLFDPKTRKVQGFTEVERRQSYIDQMIENAKDLVPLVKQCLDDDPDARPTIISVSETVKNLKDRLPKNVNVNPMLLLQQKSQLGSEIEEQKWVNDEQKREIDQKKRETEQQKTVTDQPKKEIDPLQKHIPGHQSTKQPLQKQVMKASAKKGLPEFGHSLQTGRYCLKWTKCPKLPTAMLGADATVINATLYITGGVCSNDAMKIAIVYKYDLHKNQWSYLPPLQHYSGIPVNINDQLTVIGGYHSTTQRPTALVTTLIGDNWSNAYPNLSVARVWPAVVPYQQYLIVACGLGDDGTAVNTIEVFNITTCNWTIVNIHLPKPMYAMSATICEDSFTIVGYVGTDKKRYKGTFTIPANEIIQQQIQQPLTSSSDKDNTKWHTLADAPYLNTALVPNTSSPIIIGGSDEQGNAVNDITMYDYTENKWKKIASLPINCARATVAIINDSIVVMGGASDTKTIKTTNATALSDVNIGQLVPCD